MDSVILGTLVFFFAITFTTFLWGVFVAYRTGLIGQRYAKHRRPEQYIDLEQAFDASLSSGKSETVTLAPSFYKASNTPSVTSLASLHFRARSCVVPPPTPSETLSRPATRVPSQRRRPWWVTPEEDSSDTEESFGEEIQMYVHEKVTPPREITMPANGNAAVDREALQVHMEPFQPNGKMHPAPRHSSAALNKWSSPEPRLTYKPSSLRNCLSLDSDVPELSKSPTLPQFPSENPEPESEQSHAHCPPAWMDPREFIAFGSPLRDSQVLSQNRPCSEYLPCAAVECEDPFKQCMTTQESDADSASDVSLSAAATHSDAVVSPEERDSYFMMDYDDDMRALERPLSMLYADFRTVKNRMQADSIPRANTDSCLLRVS